MRKIGNEEKGIFQNFRSSRILQLNDLKKISRKKSSIALPIPTFVEQKKVSKKRKYSEIDPERFAQKIHEKDPSIKNREQSLKEKENLVNQYLSEFKIDCPKDFHYEDYFEKKRDELQELLLKDPIMSVDELFDLESLKLVFGTSAIKKDGEEMEQNGEEVALRKRKYYDFSGTNVKVDELMSHSPILKNEEYPEISYFENNRQNNYFQPEIHRVQNLCENPDPTRIIHQESLGKKSVQFYPPAPVYKALNEPVFQAKENYIPYRTFHQVQEQQPVYFIEKENPRYENYDEHTKLYVYDIIPKKPYLIEQPASSFQGMRVRDQSQNYPIQRQKSNNTHHQQQQVIHFEDTNNNYAKKHYRY